MMPRKPAYLFAKTPTESERNRLSMLEAYYDASTIAHLERLGVEAGWDCLEVGAGGGSIARWLCDRVGPAGRVLATDLDIRFLNELDLPNLDVRCHDVLTDELPEGRFDLVHMRAVLHHLHGRQAHVLARLVGALKLGGWLLAEEPDAFTAAAHPGAPWGDVLSAFGQLPDASYEWARALPASLSAQGLEDVECDVEVAVFPGASSYATFAAATVEALREPLLCTPALSESCLEEALRALDDPGAWFFSMAMIAAWGRRPTQR
jgi:SAM-dependent methyltransferase